MRVAVAVLLTATLLLGTGRAAAQANAVVLEIDAAAEQLLDARAARRLVVLELSDVEVPSASAGHKSALFYRIVGEAGGFLRIELWERGELHAARIVSTAPSGSQLIARRVALAAAELARGLRQKRLARQREGKRQAAEERLSAHLLAQRTAEGPVALRGSVTALFSHSLTLFGSALETQLSVRGATRFDLAARWLLGWDADGNPGVSWLETSLGPARRFKLGARWDLDLAAFGAAAVVHLGRARALDGIPGQHDSWSARAGVHLRLEPRLTRSLRGSLGLEAATLLRPIPSATERGVERVRGAQLGLNLGVVLTPL